MFNTQPAVDEFERLQKLYGFDCCVETGTRRGFGSMAANRFCKVVVTIEKVPESWNLSREEFVKNGYRIHHQGEDHIVFKKYDKTISSVLGDSGKVLDTWLSHQKLEQPICFYLDAHWEDYWPLRDELKAIRDHRKGQDVIIIHDAKVPQSVIPGNGHLYCSYGGKDCDYEYVKDLLDAINPKYTIAYNMNGGPQGILYALPPK